MDITIEKLNHNDINKFIELIRVFEDVFEMKNFEMPSEIHLQQLLQKDDFFVFVALLEQQGRWRIDILHNAAILFHITFGLHFRSCCKKGIPVQGNR